MEKAINILVEAQRECEKEYLEKTNPPDEEKGLKTLGGFYRREFCKIGLRNQNLAEF